MERQDWTLEEGKENVSVCRLCTQASYNDSEIVKKV
jgi:hypothetical protein